MPGLVAVPTGDAFVTIVSVRVPSGQGPDKPALVLVIDPGLEDNAQMT
jgi:hypothetical protein